MGQRSSETASELADEIRNFVTNYQEEGTGELNVREALSQLKERRQDLERKRKQQQDEKTEKIKQTKEKIQKTEKVLSELRALVEEQNLSLIHISYGRMKIRFVPWAKREYLILPVTSTESFT